MRTKKHLLAAFGLLAFLQLLVAQDTADTEQHGRRSLTLTKAEAPPILDGSLDDAAWRNSEIIGNFLQKDPEEGMDASETTEVRALYDEENLYFGVRCLDAEAEAILATELRRDNSFANDDSFAVILEYLS